MLVPSNLTVALTNGDRVDFSNVLNHILHRVDELTTEVEWERGQRALLETKLEGLRVMLTDKDDLNGDEEKERNRTDPAIKVCT